VADDKSGVVIPLPGSNPENMVEAHERQRKAAELRMAGASYPDIAKVLRFTDKAHAHRAVQAALDRTPADGGLSIREEYTHLSIARCERLLRGVWATAVAGTDLKATDSALRIIERECKLLGLDAPTRLAVTDETKMEMLSLLNELETTLIPGEVVSERASDRPF
jgi:hypothetical protein